MKGTSKAGTKQYVLWGVIAALTLALGLMLCGCQSGPSGSGTSNESPTTEAVTPSGEEEPALVSVNVPTKITITNGDTVVSTEDITYSELGMVKTDKLSQTAEDGAQVVTNTAYEFGADGMPNHVTVTYDGSVVLDSAVTVTTEEEGTGYVLKRVADQNTATAPVIDEQGTSYTYINMDDEFAFQEDAPMKGIVSTTGYKFDEDLYTTVDSIDFDANGKVTSYDATVNMNDGTELEPYTITLTYATSGNEETLTVTAGDQTREYKLTYDSDGTLTKVTSADGNLVFTFDYTTVETDDNSVVSRSMCSSLMNIVPYL